jgi:hypothetical protein
LKYPKIEWKAKWKLYLYSQVNAINFTIVTTSSSTGFLKLAETSIKIHPILLPHCEFPLFDSFFSTQECTESSLDMLGRGTCFQGTCLDQARVCLVKSGHYTIFITSLRFLNIPCSWPINLLTIIARQVSILIEKFSEIGKANYKKYLPEVVNSL